MTEWSFFGCQDSYGLCRAPFSTLHEIVDGIEEKEPEAFAWLAPAQIELQWRDLYADCVMERVLAKMDIDWCDWKLVWYTDEMRRRAREEFDRRLDWYPLVADYPNFCDLKIPPRHKDREREARKEAARVYYARKRPR